MNLHPPFVIGSRLLPALPVGGATLSLEHVRIDRDGRDVYQWFIDLPDGSEHSAADLRTGCQGGTTQEAFGSLLSFLGAAAESYAYAMRTGREGEHADLFPAPVAEWAHQHSDALSALQLEIEESGAVLIDD